MNDAYILIENGKVVFSDKLLQSFPEITATVTGDIVTIGNVWREDLISVINDNIFWAEQQAFKSFSIIFNNNSTSVDTLSNLLVRYVNFHDENFSISLPKYTNNIEILYDPLALGVRPNYFEALQKYLNKEISLQKLAEVVYENYLLVLPKYDDSCGDENFIVKTLGSIPLEDIDKFLNSPLQAIPIYQTVKGELATNSTGVKAYSLQTSTKDFVFNVDNGKFNITNICAEGEDTTELRQIVLSKATVVTQCFLKSMTCSEFLNSSIKMITTYFGATVTFTEDSDVKEIYINIHKFGGNSNLLGELIADILTVAKSSGFVYVNLEEHDKYVNGISYGVYNIPYKALTISTDLSVQTFSVAKSILDNKSATNGSCIELITPKIIDNATSEYPKNLLTDVTKAYVLDAYKEQFFTCGAIESIYIFNRSYLPFYSSGVAGIVSPNDFSFIGTPLKSKVNKIILNDQTADAQLTSMAFRFGFRDIVNNGNGTKIIGTRGIGTRNVGFDWYPADTIFELIDAGVTEFDKLRIDVEKELSLAHTTIKVDSVTPGMLLLCPFSKEIGDNGYFESNYDVTNYDNSLIYKKAFLWCLGQIDVNEVSLASKQEVLKILIGNTPIVVTSQYQVRAADLTFLTNLLNVLRDGYKTKFRFSSDLTEIKDTENSFAYSTLETIYISLFQELSSYKKLFSIGQGVAVQYTPTPLVLDYTSVVLNISNSGISRNSGKLEFGTKGDIGGYLSLSCSDIDGDAIVFEPANYDTLPIKGYGDVFEEKPGIINYTYSNSELVLYYLVRNGENYHHQGVNGDIVGNPYTTNITIWYKVINTRNHCSYVSDRVTIDSPVIYDPTAINGRRDPDPIPKPTVADYGTIQSPKPIKATIPTEMQVIYKPTLNADGSITVDYQALDKDGTDITNQFNTFTFGETFLHKDFA